jgi:hypothetical protein
MSPGPTYAPPIIIAFTRASRNAMAERVVETKLFNAERQNKRQLKNLLIIASFAFVILTLIVVTAVGDGFSSSDASALRVRISIGLLIVAYGAATIVGHISTRRFFS